jgi:hypothetical protein
LQSKGADVYLVNTLLWTRTESVDVGRLMEKPHLTTSNGPGAKPMNGKKKSRFKKENEMQGLTEKQYKAFIWIKEFIQDKGWSPSYEEIGKGLGISTNSAIEMVGRIVDRGYLLNDKSKPRSLGLPE